MRTKAVTGSATLTTTAMYFLSLSIFCSNIDKSSVLYNYRICLIKTRSFSGSGSVKVRNRIRTLTTTAVYFFSLSIPGSHVDKSHILYDLRLLMGAP